MTDAKAWLLQFDDEHWAAVGLHELVEVLPRPRVYHVPLGNPFCRDVVVWRGELLPVVNFARARRVEGAELPIIAVAAYQVRPGAVVENGAFELQVLPKTMSVTDDMAAPIPKQAPWPALSLSCFALEARPIPIIDVPQIFRPISTRSSDSPANR